MTKFAHVSPASLPLGQLIREIERKDVVPPVRLMEEVLRRSPRDAVPALVSKLREMGIGTTWAPLWLIVLLGEFRRPIAAPALANELGRKGDPDPWTAQGAAEALAKIGSPAIEVLRDCTASDVWRCRMYAYAALGWIGSPAACRILIEALERDPGTADALACALGDAACGEAVEPLHASLSGCDPFLRPVIEQQIQRLHRGEKKVSPAGEDWRRRYRPRGRRVFAAGWPHRLRALRERREWPRMRTHGPPVRPLEEILAGAARPRAQPPVCYLCPLPAVSSTGIHACELHAPELIREQAELLENAARDMLSEGLPFRWQSGRSVFDLLAFVDTRISAMTIMPHRLVLGEGDPRTALDLPWSPALEAHPWVERRYAAALAAARDPLDTHGEGALELAVDHGSSDPDDEDEDGPTAELTAPLRIVRATCHWLLEQGCEDLGDGLTLLHREAFRARSLGPAPHDGPRLLSSGDVPAPAAVAAHPEEAPRAPDLEWLPPREGRGAEGRGLLSIRDDRIHRTLDRYYRRWIDTPLAELDGSTPRQAAEDVPHEVLEYVRGFEAAEEARSKEGNIAYDFGWLRRELGLDRIGERG